jgi:hypothetical protein
MKYTLIVKNRIPLSQNARSRRAVGGLFTLFEEYKRFLQGEFDLKYSKPLEELLYGKIFYIHKSGDTRFLVRDADNISKPLWDALNKKAFDDDKQIRLRIASKLESNVNDFQEINFENMDDKDFDELCLFLDATNADQQFIYIEIGKFEHNMVKLGE